MKIETPLYAIIRNGEIYRLFESDRIVFIHGIFHPFGMARGLSNGMHHRMATRKWNAFDFQAKYLQL